MPAYTKEYGDAFQEHADGKCTKENIFCKGSMAGCYDSTFDYDDYVLIRMEEAKEEQKKMEEQLRLEAQKRRERIWKKIKKIFSRK